ncbi:MAG: UDP-N-acetylmuramoyl-tripeptide--D-alanyl-D-alanine ligase [Lachnospiraceae bacterium]|nr:UDP-N-acetylmuramoyl-tripeptide--D-alanyl-D-alanine ligase [Lachnospiraceae bacterium]
MMKNITFNNLAKVLSAEKLILKQEGDFDPDREAAGVEIDSRKVEKDGIFFCIQGERSDGHSFLSEVAARGARFAVVEKPLEDLPKPLPLPCLKVDSTLFALEDMGAYYRSLFDCKVVGVTGSTGKTSTKDFIYSVMSEKFLTLATAGNMNSNIGLPLMVMRLNDSYEAACLEMGINHPGEMSRLAKVARPDIAIITNIGVSHIENLGSQNGIMEEKLHIADYMDGNGTLFLNGDDPLLQTLRGKREGLVFFGKSKENDIYLDEVLPFGLRGTEALIRSKAESSIFSSPLKVTVSLPGQHMLYNALAAAAVGSALGLSREEIANGISKMKSAAGRSNVIEAGSLTILDDCYNASPDSMKAAFALMQQAEVSAGEGKAHQRRVYILGDMFELGSRQEEMHFEVGEAAAETAPDLLITIGALARQIHEGAANRIERERITHFDSVEEFLDGENIKRLINRGDIVLVKASRGMRFERIVKALQAFEIKT